MDYPFGRKQDGGSNTAGRVGGNACKYNKEGHKDGATYAKRMPVPWDSLKEEISERVWYIFVLLVMN